MIEIAYRALREAYEDHEILAVSLWTAGGIQVENQQALLDRFGEYDIRPCETKIASYYAEHMSESGVRWYALVYTPELTEEDRKKLGLEELDD